MNASSKPVASRGIASVLAIILLALFATIAAAFASETSLNFRKAGNVIHTQNARLQAESAVAFYSHLLRRVNLPSGASGQAMLDALALRLQARLEGTANLGAQGIMYDGTTITVPAIATNAHGGAFSASFALNANGTVLMAVSGAEFGCIRQVRMSYDLTPGRSGVFDYGVASKGKIVMTGNARILGANDPAEANVFTGTFSDPEAVKLTGNCQIAGDLDIQNPGASVAMTGNVSIGGESLWGGHIADHIHMGVDDVEFPEADPFVFEPFATHIVDGSTPTNGNKTFTNIRIKANTNPTFAGNIKLRGVVYIETPNRVTFAGNLDIIGVIVTEDAGEGALDDNYLHFTGNTSTQGVEHLPDEPQYAALKQLPGTFLLAPGFSTKFTGNFGTVNGAMAASEFRWTGNAGGTIHGPIINFGDTEFKLTGNAHLTIDRGSSPETPPGFASAAKLTPLPGTYEEL